MEKKILLSDGEGTKVRGMNPSSREGVAVERLLPRRP